MVAFHAFRHSVRLAAFAVCPVCKAACRRSVRPCVPLCGLQLSGIVCRIRFAVLPCFVPCPAVLCQSASFHIMSTERSLSGMGSIADLQPKEKPSGLIADFACRIGLDVWLSDNAHTCVRISRKFPENFPILSDNVRTMCKKITWFFPDHFPIIFRSFPDHCTKNALSLIMYAHDA